ncbi:hypothetical protein FOA52_003956 [Chlamydomonas sp. UWO 241]|nr:hypothetical protein FOA52_003956 [Chlamydomonas sp. UWO 241]
MSGTTVIRSPNDKKEYRYLVLESGLTALLIHDPEITAQGPASGGDQDDGRKAKRARTDKGAKAGGKKEREHEDEEGDMSEGLDEDEDEEDEEGESDEGESGDEGEEEDSSGSGSGDEEMDGNGGKRGSKGDESGDGDDDEEGGGGKKEETAQKKAAAAMCVGVGSFSDPEHMQFMSVVKTLYEKAVKAHAEDPAITPPELAAILEARRFPPKWTTLARFPHLWDSICRGGLSHYLEHMLFMGSVKYPSENDYDEFISEKGGSSNAYTELEHTNYHFEVSPDALHGALDRFAQFFLAPLCLEGSLEREVLAVDSEFSGVQQEDACRVSQLICHTAEVGHMYRSFSWGNKKSLWDEPKAAGIDIRGEILKHYEKHYSAERMCLCVLGGESLDTQEDWVRSLFEGLPSGKGPRPDFVDAGMPYKGRHFYAMPAVKDHHEIAITFPMPSLFKLYRKKAEHYISHLVGHEGAGSLLSALKRRGWATDLCAGIDPDGHSQNTACHLFGITVTLTEAGLAAGPGLGLAVVDMVFERLGSRLGRGWAWRWWL